VKDSKLHQNPYYVKLEMLILQPIHLFACKKGNMIEQEN
jgi:hypothetical protein